MTHLRALGCLAALLAAAACAEPPEEPTPDTLRILAYNIHHGEGMDSIVDLGRIARLIEELDVDVVTLQEVDSMTRRTGLVDQTRELAGLTGMSAAFGRFMDHDGGAYGMAVLSRWPMEEAMNWPLPEGPEPRTALGVRVRSPATGTDALVVGIHLYGTTDERLAQASALIDLLRNERGPTILAGDFNSTPGSPVMEWLSLGWTVPDKGEDRFTFPSFRPDREIDYLVYRPAESIEVLEQKLIDEAVISDHRPLVATLVLR